MCYTRLQGVTKDFRGLQAVTMVTGGYKGLKDFLNGKINLFENSEPILTRNRTLNSNLAIWYLL